MPADLEAIYDVATLARLDRSDRERRPAAVAGDGEVWRPRSWRRRVVVGSLVTGLTLGLREVFDPPPDDEVIEEVDAGAPPRDDRPVCFEMVDGPPAASRIVLRPWLVGP